METIKRLEIIMQEVLETPLISLTNETTAKDIDGWDSINHVYLIVEIEKTFKLKFQTREIQGWQNVGDIVISIDKRMNA